jgi:hypothetical protein
LQLLKEEGVAPTVGQALGGRAGAVEEKLQSLPVVGDMIANARGNANKQFSKAVINRSLSPIGKKLPEGIEGREAVAFAEQALKQNYDDVLSRIGAVKVDGSYKMKVTSLRSMVNKMRAPKEVKAEFDAALDAIDSTVDKGYITSDAFKNIESNLGRRASNLQAAPDNFRNDVGGAVKQLQQELRDMLRRQAGPEADSLAKANKGWANFKRVQKAAGYLGAEDGNFSPAQFQGAVKAADRSKDKAAFARGDALLQDLGDAGKSVLSGKVGNSFTADRMMLGGGALGGLGYLNPMTAAGLAGGAALYLSPIQRALVGSVSSRPQFAQPVAEAVRQSSPYLLPAIPGLLNQ